MFFYKQQNTVDYSQNCRVGKNPGKNEISQQQQLQKLIGICKKVMLCIWWDLKGIVNYKHLPQDQKLNIDPDQFKGALNEKRLELPNWKDDVSSSIGTTSNTMFRHKLVHFG